MEEPLWVPDASLMTSTWVPFIKERSHVKLTATDYFIMLDYPAAQVQTASALGPVWPI